MENAFKRYILRLQEQGEHRQQRTENAVRYPTMRKNPTLFTNLLANLLLADREEFYISRTRICSQRIVFATAFIWQHFVHFCAAHTFLKSLVSEWQVASGRPHISKTSSPSYSKKYNTQRMLLYLELILLCFYSYYLLLPAWHYKDLYWIFCLFTFLSQSFLSQPCVHFLPWIEEFNARYVKWQKISQRIKYRKSLSKINPKVFGNTRGSLIQSILECLILSQ